MKPLSALIIDDERLARAELRRLLSDHPAVEVIGEPTNAEEARRSIAELSPDLLFLDVEMPGETGFDLLSTLEAVPLVVFTTAYDEYALRAFEVSAIDYLVKPIDPDRLDRTIRRLQDSLAPQGVEEAIFGPLAPRHRIFVKDGDRCWFLELGRVRLLESEGNYVRVFFDAEKPLINRSLDQLEGKLDSRTFFRANRSQIINLEAVDTIDVWFDYRLRAKLTGGEEVVLSRRRSRDFRQRMSI